MKPFVPGQTVERNGHPPWYVPEGVPTGLKVANSLTGDKVDFIPKEGRKVTWYTCGPTVYDYSHMGHARAVLTFDILRRIMEDYFGFEVVYQTNITDIDDKIILKSRRNYILAQYEAEMKDNPTRVEADLNAAVAAALAKAEKEVNHWQNLPATAQTREAAERETKLKEAELKYSQASELSAAAKEAIASKDVGKMIRAGRGALEEALDKERMDSVPVQTVFAEHARKYERLFWEDCESLGCRLPTAVTRVTEYVPDCVTYIAKIIENGHAYESNGSVYFDTNKFRKTHSYPKLVPSAGLCVTAAEMAEGEGALASTFVDEKKHPNDFALWKKSKAGEPKWPSPWSEGRPGWHIECSVMANDVMGNHLDIHGGGSDLKFPHHDNEMAQSEAFHCCQQWVNYWFHCGHLHIKGLKMAKSLKNFITIRDALQTHTARQIRLMFLTQTWDRAMDYSDQTMNQAKDYEKRLNSFFGTVKALQRKDWVAEEQRWHDPEKELNDVIVTTEKKVHEYICDNFNTADVLLSIADLMTAVNKYLDAKESPVYTVVQKATLFITKILRVFGVIEGVDDLGFPSQGGGDDTRFASVMDAFSGFRDHVRSSVKDENMKAAVLAACDDVRDNALVECGVRLEDIPGKPSVWKEQSTESLRKEQAEKAAQKLEDAMKKINNKLAEKTKDVEKWKAASVDPALHFTTGQNEGKYTTDRDEKGLPTTLANGDPVPKSQMKSNAKDHEKRVKTNAEFTQKGGATFLDGLVAEQRALEADVAKMRESFNPPART
jgi:cysteinyl-tRNA synthetase